MIWQNYILTKDNDISDSLYPVKFLLNNQASYYLSSAKEHLLTAASVAASAINRYPRKFSLMYTNPYIKNFCKNSRKKYSLCFQVLKRDCRTVHFWVKKFILQESSFANISTSQHLELITWEYLEL